MEEIQNLAIRAATHFNLAEYDKAYQLFLELKQKTTSNKEVLMNLSISDYYQRGCSNPSKLLDELSSIYKSTLVNKEKDKDKDKEPSSSSSSSSTATSSSSSSSSPTENTSPNTSPVLSSKDSSSLTASPAGGIDPSSSPLSSPTAATTTSTTSSAVETFIDSEQAILLYNQAVILHAMKQHGSAYEHLDLLYQNILFLDDYVAIRICLLLVNVATTVQMYDKAYSVILHLEQNFSHLYYNNKDVSPIGDEGSDPVEQQTSSSSWTNTLMTPTEFRFIIHLYKAKLFLLSSTNDNLHLAKEEIKNAISRAVKINYKLLPSCHLLKANYYNMLGSNTSKTVQFLNLSKDGTNESPIEPTTPPTNTPPPSTKAKNSKQQQQQKQLQQQQQQQQASQQINPISFGIDLFIEDITPQIYFNNLGCLHFNLNKFTSSIFYFTKALKSSTNTPTTTSTTTNNNNNNGKSSSSSTSPSLTIDFRSIENDNRTEIFYNTGSLLLLTGKPELAFSCLQEACLLLHNNPIIWLRLAECCVMAHIQRCREDDKSNQSNSIHVYDKDDQYNKRLLLPTQSGLHKGLQIEDSDVQSTLVDENDESIRLGTLSLEFGAKCLRNSYYIQKKVLKQQQQQQCKNTSTGKKSNLPPSSSSSSSSTISSTSSPSQSNINMELYHQNAVEVMLNILLSQAYIALCTSNPVVSLTSSKELLALCNEYPGGQYDKYKFYGHLYAAESCIMLNAPDEAIGYLPPQFIDSIKDFSGAAGSSNTSGVGNSGGAIGISIGKSMQSGSSNISLGGSGIGSGGGSSSGSGSIGSNGNVNISSPLSTSDYKNIFYTNLAVAYLVKDNIDDAMKCISNILNERQQQQQQHGSSSNNSMMTEFDGKLILLQVYIELRAGRKLNALSILSKQRPVPLIFS